MQFLAADCRIFYTPATFNNFTNLWKHAAAAAWTSPDLCVANSTGYATSKSTKPKPAPFAVPLAAVNYSSIGIPTLTHVDADIPFLVADLPLPDGGGSNTMTNIRGPGSPYSGLYQGNAKYLYQNNQLRQPKSNSPRHGSLQDVRRIGTCTAPPFSKKRRRRYA